MPLNLKAPNDAITIERAKSFRFSVRLENKMHSSILDPTDELFFSVKPADFDTDDTDSDASIMSQASLEEQPNGEYLAIFKVQASQTNIEPQQYFYSVTRIPTNGYSTVLVKGKFTVVPNTLNKSINYTYSDVLVEDIGDFNITADGINITNVTNSSPISKGVDGYGMYFTSTQLSEVEEGTTVVPASSIFTYGRSIRVGDFILSTGTKGIVTVVDSLQITDGILISATVITKQVYGIEALNLYQDMVVRGVLHDDDIYNIPQEDVRKDPAQEFKIGDTIMSRFTDGGAIKGVVFSNLIAIDNDSEQLDTITLQVLSAYDFTAMPGPQGPPGENGTNGVTPVVTVIGTTTLPVGENATVTNQGTAPNVALQFGIPKGADGVDATQATVDVGTTTTAVPTTPASVINSGDNINAVLNFTIPKGEKGDPGENGMLLNLHGGIYLDPRNEYTGTQDPTPQPLPDFGDTVEGDAYTVIAADDSHYDLFFHGIDGTDWSIIEDWGGIPGPPGQSSTITIGTTTTGNPGTPANVTDSGTALNHILNFTIPKGDTGSAGIDGRDGTNGTDGLNSTVSVGSTTTLPAGSQATVSNSGTANDAVFNFGIPKGQDGANPGAGVITLTDGSGAILGSFNVNQTQNQIIEVEPVGVDITSLAWTDYSTATPYKQYLKVILYGDEIRVFGSYSKSANSTTFLNATTASNINVTLGSVKSGYYPPNESVVGTCMAMWSINYHGSPATVVDTNGTLTVIDSMYGWVLNQTGGDTTSAPSQALFTFTWNQGLYGISQEARDRQAEVYAAVRAGEDHEYLYKGINN